MAKKKTKIYFLRKPLKPVLYMGILCVLLIAALIFALQFELDKKAIQDIIDNYSYVATIYNNQRDAAALRPLPEDLIKRVSESKYTRDVENRNVYSGRAEGMNAILDYFVTDDSIDLYGAIEGTLIPEDFNVSTGNEFDYLAAYKSWAEVLNGMRAIEVCINHPKNPDGTFADLDAFNELSGRGQIALVIGRFDFDRSVNSINYSRINIFDQHISAPQNRLDRRPILVPDVYATSSEKIEEYLTEKLKEEGIYDDIQKINACKNIFTIRPVSDMSMLMSFADHTTYICSGRGLTKADRGQKVCLINAFIARKSNLYVGDHIKLAISDTNYSHKVATHDAIWVNGIPGLDDDLPEYGEYEDYEIVGMYNFYVQRNCEEDFFKFSRNDVFVPADSTEAESYANLLPCNFSFRILGPDYEDFMDEFEIEIFENGYVLHAIDDGWEDLQSNYETMMSRKLVSLFSATVTMIAAIVLFCILLLKHFRYEFGLRRLLGASSVEASGIYVAGYFILGIPAILISMAVTLVVYDKWLAAKMIEVVENGLPKMTEVISLLSVWIGIAFGAGFVLLMISGLVNGKKNLLKMIK